MKKGAIIIVVVLVIATVTTVGIIGYKQGWFSSGPSDAEFQKMLDQSRNLGHDTFEGLSVEQAKAFLPYATSDDIQKWMAFEKRYSNSQIQDTPPEMMQLFAKMTGKTIRA